MSNREVDNAMARFRLEEAQWLDSVVKGFFPQWVIKIMSLMDRTRGLHFLGRICHFFIDIVIISKVLKITIERSQDREVLSKGFRESRVRLNQVRTKVSRKGKLIAEKGFKIGVIL